MAGEPDRSEEANKAGQLLVWQSGERSRGRVIESASGFLGAAKTRWRSYRQLEYLKMSPAS